MYTSGWPKYQNRCCQSSGSPPPDGANHDVPSVVRHAEQVHAGGAHVDDGRDVVDRAHHGADTHDEEADAPEVLTPVHARVLRHRGQRRIRRPAGGGVAAFDEEPAEHDEAGRERRPERQHVEERKGHVARADHERDAEVAEGAGQDRHDHEEDHDGGVHGERHVVGGRLEDPARLPEDAAHPGDRRLRPGQLPADDEGQEPAQDHHEEPEEQELARDHLVIGREDVRAHEAGLVMLVRGVRGRGVCAHFFAFPPGFVSAGFAASAGFAVSAAFAFAVRFSAAHFL